jgi:hypothetical protein
VTARLTTHGQLTTQNSELSAERPGLSVQGENAKDRTKNNDDTAAPADGSGSIVEDL